MGTIRGIILSRAEQQAVLENIVKPLTLALAESTIDTPELGVEQQRYDAYTCAESIRYAVYMGGKQLTLTDENITHIANELYCTGHISRANALAIAHQLYAEFN